MLLHNLMLSLITGDKTNALGFHVALYTATIIFVRINAPLFRELQDTTAGPQRGAVPALSFLYPAVVILNLFPAWEGIWGRSLFFLQVYVFCYVLASRSNWYAPEPETLASGVGPFSDTLLVQPASWSFHVLQMIWKYIGYWSLHLWLSGPLFGTGMPYYPGFFGLFL